MAVYAQQPVGNRIRLLTRNATADDALRRAPQVLDKHDAQRYRDRPELTDSERLHALIGAYEAPQDFRVEAAVGVRHKRPRHTEHARVACERTGRELRQ